MLLGICIAYWRSVNLPTAAGVYALVVVVLTVLAGLRFAGGLALTALSSLAILGLLQSQRLVPTDTDWLVDGIQAADIMGFLTIFMVMALAAWASGREAKRSAAQMVALQQPAEMGRLVTHLLHDLANPIAVAALNLEQIDSQQCPSALQGAITSIRCLERYVEAARKQVQQQGEPERFRADYEIAQVVMLLVDKARWRGVELDTRRCQLAWLYGVPARFNQLVLNLVTNAIEAYAEVPIGPQPRAVGIEVTRVADQVVVRVSDKGDGVVAADKAKLFRPFFTTKPTDGKVRGLGLAIARQIACDEFGGTIEITSAAQTTGFTVTLPASAPG